MFATRHGVEKEKKIPFASGAACNDFLAPLSVSWCKVQRRWIDRSDASGLLFKLFSPFNVHQWRPTWYVCRVCEIRSTARKKHKNRQGKHFEGAVFVSTSLLPSVAQSQKEVHATESGTWTNSASPGETSVTLLPFFPPPSTHPVRPLASAGRNVDGIVSIAMRLQRRIRALQLWSKSGGGVPVKRKYIQRGRATFAVVHVYKHGLKLHT